MKTSAILLLLSVTGSFQIAAAQLPAPNAPAAPKNTSISPLQARPADLLLLDNGHIKVGVDRNRGAAITWLSNVGYPSNVVNYSDPGRLIQQSYYAGKSLDRQAEGQSKAWSPWPWNPIQGGGVDSWARCLIFQRNDDATLYTVTIPKLWDMPDEEAAALMRQWTGIEPDLPDVVVVRCELDCTRLRGDRWGSAAPRPQELPACYFTRNFSVVKSYLGNGEWRLETQPPGPPWGQTRPPRQAMALFNPAGMGVAVFSPAADHHWNFGPHGAGASADPADLTCMHVAPIGIVPLGPRTSLHYRYWLTLGTEAQLTTRLDVLAKKYPAEKIELGEGKP